MVSPGGLSFGGQFWCVLVVSRFPDPADEYISNCSCSLVCVSLVNKKGPSAGRSFGIALAKARVSLMLPAGLGCYGKPRTAHPYTCGLARMW